MGSEKQSLLIILVLENRVKTNTAHVVLFHKVMLWLVGSVGTGGYGSTSSAVTKHSMKRSHHISFALVNFHRF